MKKFLAIAIALVLLVSACFVFVSCDEKDDGKFKVGICQFVQHPALDQATQGFMDALIAELGEENVEFDVQNASEKSDLCNTIVNSFITKGVDLIMANATPALQAAYAATEGNPIPVLGTSITEYGVALGIDNFSGVVGGNVSGTSDLAPLDKQVDMILELCPNVDKVGIIYCSSEANSKYQVEKVTEFLAAKGVAAKAFPFSNSNDVSAIVEGACAECDVLYIPTDNKAATCAPTIGEIVREKRIPVFTGEENVARECGVASLSISYYDLGITTGKMAAKILKGEADISTMEIQYAPYTKKYNKEMCEFLGIVIPEGYVEIK